MPHEVDIDANLSGGKDLIIVSLGEDLRESSVVVANEDPVEVQDFSFHLLKIRIVSNVGFGFNGIRVLQRSIVILCWFSCQLFRQRHLVLKLFFVFFASFAADERLHVAVGKVSA